MSRNKGMAPPTPMRMKNNSSRDNGSKISKDISKTQDSLVILFDELTRNSRVLEEGSEEQFLQFAVNQGFCRKRWQHAENEYIRVSSELQLCEAEVRKLEMKLGQARDLLASETTLRKKAEQERDQLSQKWELVREFFSQPENGNTLNDETRIKLQKLEASWVSRRATTTALFSPGGLPVVNESSDSILDPSELSQSFDDTQGSVLAADDSKLRSGRVYKRKSSGGGGAQAAARREKRSKGSNGRGKSLEAAAARRSKGVEKYNERDIDAFIPSAPPIPLEEKVNAWRATSPSRGQSNPCSLPYSGSTVTLTPSHASTVTLVPQTPTTPYEPGNPVRRTHSNRGMNRSHQFVQKNNFKTETCGPCQRRIKFGKICFKCRECHAVSHPECRDRVPLPCVPSGAATKTPVKPGKGYTRGTALADHTPHTSPMVPAIIVYCINEIEARGLGDVGIYRIPGSERDVKELRDKFLAGRGCPNLGQTDVHVLCGTVKDFLRNLREPLVPSSMWHIFTQAASNPDCTDAESALYQAVSELPQPNRDTMAFIMLHLQKVSAAKETKMNQSNLAKILGPTIIGYSNADAQPEEIMKEVGAQTATMEKLIAIDSDYWSTFLSQGTGEDLYPDNRLFSPGTPEIMQASIFRTPGADGAATPMMSTRRSMTPAAARSRNLDLHTGGGKIFASPVML